jgi:hypothetical protein
MSRRLLSADQLAEISQLAAQGWTLNRLAERFNCHHMTIRRALNPALYPMPGRPKTLKRENATPVALRQDFAARLTEIPPDTRSLTGKIFGDPLPGRSAFDRLRA